MELHNQANIKVQPEIEGNQEKLAQTQWRRREKKKDENGANQRRGGRRWMSSGVRRSWEVAGAVCGGGGWLTCFRWWRMRVRVRDEGSREIWRRRIEYWGKMVMGFIL